MVTIPLNEKEDLAARLLSLAEDLLAFHQSRASDRKIQTIKELRDLIPQALISEDPSISEIIVTIVPLLPIDIAEAIFDSFLKSHDGQNQLRALEVAAYTFEPEVISNLAPEIYTDNFVTGMPEELQTSAKQLQGLLLGRPMYLMSTLAPTKLKSITTVIHGTWAKDEVWWQPGSQFMNGVAGKVKDLYIDPDYFIWSGANNDQARRQAAQELLSWVSQHLVQNGSLQLICHSHGGNVAMIATQLGLKINNLILLGTPIRTDYTPNMKNISNVYNIYAPWDPYQSLGAMESRRGEGRTLADTSNSLNIAERTKTGGHRKSHSALHDWQVWTHPDNKFDTYLL